VLRANVLAARAVLGLTLGMECTFQVVHLSGKDDDTPEGIVVLT